MKTFYEELTDRGLSARALTLELAWTIPYWYITDKLVGMDIITFIPVKVNLN